MEDIPLILNEYRKEDPKDITKIHVILAVDSISLTPEIYIDKSGFVHGLISNEKISEKFI